MGGHEWPAHRRARGQFCTAHRYVASMRRLATSVAAAALALAACSSGDDSGSTLSADTAADPVEASDPAGEPAATGGNEGSADAEPSVSSSPAPVAPATEPAPVEVPAGPGGVVTIAGEQWIFVAEVCITEGGLIVEGPGVGPDETAAWVHVSLDTSTDFDGDGQLDTSATVAVEVGRTDLSVEPSEDHPDYYATSTRTGSFEYREFEHTLEGTRLFGSGEIQDYNAIALPFGETAEFTFDVSCT